MIFYLIVVFVAAAAGFLVAALCGSAAVADLQAENLELRRTLGMVRHPAGKNL